MREDIEGELHLLNKHGEFQSRKLGLPPFTAPFTILVMQNARIVGRNVHFKSLNKRGILYTYDEDHEKFAQTHKTTLLMSLILPSVSFYDLK